MGERVRPWLGVVAVAWLMLAPAAQAHPGDLNGMFGAAGVFRTGGFGETALGVEPAGRLVVSYYVPSSATASGSALALERLLPNGLPDPSFGTRGVVVDPTLSPINAVDAMAVQPDGRIVVTDGDQIARYTLNGSPDQTFGSGGYASTGPVSAHALALEGNGDIVIAGTGALGGMAVERFGPDGVPNGYFEHQFDTGPNAFSAATAVAVRPNGEVVAAGYAGARDPNFTAQRMVLAEFTGGGLDTSFGTGGAVIEQFGTGSEPFTQGYSVALDPRGRIVVAGLTSYQNLTFPAIVLARFTGSGAPDSTFGNGGHELSWLYPRPNSVEIDGPPPDLTGSPLGLGIQSDADLVLGITAAPRLGGPWFGGPAVGLSFAAGVARYLPSGALDRGFGLCGLTAHQFDSAGQASMSAVSDLLIQPGGQIDLAGSLAPPDGSTASQLFVARYLGGTPAAAVPPGWTATFGVPLPPAPVASALADAPDASIKQAAALIAQGQSWEDELGWWAKASVVLVPVVGDEVALVDASDVVSFLLSWSAEKIAEDPPASSYRTLAHPRSFRLRSLPAGPGVSAAAARAFDLYARNGARIASLQLAYIASSERAQAAYLAHDPIWRGRQDRAAATFRHSLIIALRRRPALATTLMRTLRGTPLARSKLTGDEIRQARRALADHGLPIPVSRQLFALGFTPREIRLVLRRELSAPAPRKLSFATLVASPQIRATFSEAANSLSAAARCGSSS